MGTSIVESGIYLQSFVEKNGNLSPVNSFSSEFSSKTISKFDPHYLIPHVSLAYVAFTTQKSSVLSSVFFNKTCRERIPDLPVQVPED